MIGRLSIYTVISAIFVWISHLLKSNFLGLFLYDNILIIIITLLAINTATYGFIIAKIDEISKGNNKDFFERATTEIKKSLRLQLYLIAAAFVLCIVYSSEKIDAFIDSNIYIFDFLFIFIFVFALDLLRDTGFAIFELRNPKENK